MKIGIIKNKRKKKSNYMQIWWKKYNLKNIRLKN